MKEFCHRTADEEAIWTELSGRTQSGKRVPFGAIGKIVQIFLPVVRLLPLLFCIIQYVYPDRGVYSCFVTQITSLDQILQNRTPKISIFL